MSHNNNDWKGKYLDALDEQEKHQRKHQQMMSLLVKAVVRISLVADGIDQTLDKQLVGLRQMLRDGSPSGRDLNTVVSALEGQVKRLDTVKSERAKAISAAFQSLASQLHSLKPEKDAKQQLQRLSKNLKTRSGRIREYSVLINEYAKVQQEVLNERNIQRVSKPFWHNWVASETVESSQESDIAVDSNTDDLSIESAPTAGLSTTSSPSDNSSLKVAVDDNDGLDLSDDKSEPLVPIDPESVGEEPPFSRLNNAICEVLSELLEQIEPPAMAKDNYRSAKQRIANGLNWYELVPTLEDISLVVISAFDSHQKDFEGFLSQLNERLGEVHQFIDTSGQINSKGVEAGRKLNVSVREQVSAMQQSVADATELEQLKSAVSSRLDQVVAAMDQHQASEQERETSLSEQLDALVERIKTMETNSEQAEQRIEEQRQKALRDVLTQLPNREAYQQRLAQEFERWQRYKRPLSMMVCDVDHFKRVNDNYGHLAGDKVLRIIAKTLAKRLRKTDFIARFGGEEFVVLMPETEQQQALSVAEGVREAIASCPFHFKEQRVSITMSFGISEFFGQDQAEQVFARSDKALYQAKDQGRNRCALAESSSGSDE